MTNNDILIRLRYALDIKDMDMVGIFGLGGIQTTKEEVQEMFLKSKSNSDSEDEDEYVKSVDNIMLESFLNGLVIFKRGVQDSNLEDPQKQVLMIKDYRNVNNILLKKVKIALSLTSEDMLDILKDTGVNISKSELSAVLRKEGQRNYKECGDRYARNFLKGLAIRYRK